MVNHLFSLAFGALAVAGAALGSAELGSTAMVPVANLAALEKELPKLRPSDPRRASFDRAADGLFYLDASVEESPVRFIVDTGATVVVLTATDARRAGVTPSGNGKSVAMKTVTGTARMHWGRISRLRIAGQELEGIDVAIVEDGLGVSLLGQNVLSRLGSITMQGDRLHIG